MFSDLVIQSCGTNGGVEVETAVHAVMVMSDDCSRSRSTTVLVSSGDYWETSTDCPVAARDVEYEHIRGNAGGPSWIKTPHTFISV